ncbi:MAG: GWxTD domain-containing protein, partial [Gemmatimonadota bacterium]
MPPALSARRLGLLGLLAAVAGCGTGRTAPGGRAAATEQTINELFNLATVYQRLGRLASPGPIPFVGNLATFAGRGDSTLVLLGLSLENHAFSFQRDRGSFAARYRVDASWQRPGMPPVQLVKDEFIRVNSFQETQRSDETILFQQAFLLAPGSYTLTVIVRDLQSNLFGRAERPIDVGTFPAGSVGGPVIAYQAEVRNSATEPVKVVLNPRGTVANGGSDTLLIYVEGYKLPGPTLVPVEVRDERDSVIYHSDIQFQGGKSAEGQVARLGSGAPPLGELAITVGAGAAAKKTTALVSFSRGWVVTNYDNLLSLLRYFPREPDLLNKLRGAKPVDRPALWRQFWTATDPNPATPENEALEQYFSRIAIANDRFRDEGGEGWRTDRGEVYVTLGEPDQSLETPPSSDRRLIRWDYSAYRVSLFFEGTFGFSRMRLSPQSRAEFARARAQAMHNPSTQRLTVQG